MATAPCAAQLTVVNPKQLAVPQERGTILLGTACRVSRTSSAWAIHRLSGFPLALVLGEREERYTVDEKKLEYKLYMKEWDETKFAALAMHLCVQLRQD